MDQKSTQSKITPLMKKRFRQATLIGWALLFLLNSGIWPGLAIDHITLGVIAVVLLSIGLLTFLDTSDKLQHSKNLAILITLVALAAGVVGFVYWRAGDVVAEAIFNPGIAPFDVTVREVPVPATSSHHFIVTLKRGQYPVTSFRYFWVGYTPQTVKIEWKQLENFKVIFDDRYVASCNWNWGRKAIWAMQVPPGAQAPGAQP